MWPCAQATATWSSCRRTRLTGRTLAKARAAIWASAFPAIRSGILCGYRTGFRYRTEGDGTPERVDACRLRHVAGNQCRQSRLYDGRLDTAAQRDDSTAEIGGHFRHEPLSRTGRTYFACGCDIGSRAAGFGDFMNQLSASPLRLRFVTRLFPAIMQGRAHRTLSNGGSRHGRARTDRLGYCGDYPWRRSYLRPARFLRIMTFAATVARFPLPVMVGIGHERDVTVLDYMWHAYV